MNYEERDAQLHKRVSDFLKELRAARKKMPLKELARKINVSAQLISNYEQGIQTLSVSALNHLRSIATAIELSLDESATLFSLIMGLDEHVLHKNSSEYMGKIIHQLTDPYLTDGQMSDFNNTLKTIYEHSEKNDGVCLLVDGHRVLYHMKMMYDTIYAAHIILKAALDHYDEEPETLKWKCEFLHNNFIQLGVLYGRKRLNFILYDYTGLAAAHDECIAPPETHIEVTFHTANGPVTAPLEMLSELIERHTEPPSQSPTTDPPQG